ncbi:MAG: tRNA (cytidine(34)-2'-O)-methyltransferase [Parvibaculum sp.]|uniref:tRNA (cytidine(34)-2'-O)-methyltransferase n=1 Tax=Parvibaculum sp. TaxID=2024848 RepID=UPI0027207B1F|nr:tRNA (cytidine(34)-2'-O)-methyltransferase [Parvibaculum sp.]MDO8839971.1 tRNA (cytidine(34)-2'-O)-methyltransferase [Parvibaculum sp.]
MRLALYEPDIPPNVGTLLRLGACLGIPVDIIEPCGFPWSDRDLKRAAMDYGALAEVTRHASWDDFRRTQPHTSRLVLLTTKTHNNFVDFRYRPSDILLVGRESAGVPDEVHAAADGRVTIPMRPPARSLNMAVAAAMVLSEALRQTAGFPAGFPAAK